MNYFYAENKAESKADHIQKIVRDEGPAYMLMVLNGYVNLAHAITDSLSDYKLGDIDDLCEIVEMYKILEEKVFSTIGRMESNKQKLVMEYVGLYELRKDMADRGITDEFFSQSSPPS